MPDVVLYLIGFALGFAGGYGVREYMSRVRHRRYRELKGQVSYFGNYWEMNERQNN